MSPNVIQIVDFSKSSRFPLMVTEGLISLFGMGGVLTTDDTFLLGNRVAYTLNPADTVYQLKNASWIWLPDQDHHGGWHDYRAVIERHDLWHKVIYYDFRDEPKIDFDILSKAKVYAKRNHRGREGVVPMEYGAMGCYFGHDMGDWEDRPIEVLCPLRDRGKPTVNAHNRYKVLLALKKHFPQEVSFKTTPVVGRQGRRAIFGNDMTPHMFDYWKLLANSKIVVTCEPDHLGGDSRTWESFAAKCIVVVDRPHQDFLDFEESKCVTFNPDEESSIVGAVNRALAAVRLTNHGKDVAQAGYATVLRHMAINRVQKVMDHAFSK